VKEKVVFFDIDGTLVNEEKELLHNTKEAIYRLRDKGVYLVLATGRPPFWYEELRDELSINSYISYNGQHIVFEGEIIYENPINRNSLSKLYKDMLKYDIPMAFLDDEEMVVTRDNHPFIQKCFINLLHEYPRISDDFHKKRKIFQALLFTENSLDPSLFEKYSMFNFLRWHKYSYDLLPRGSSKARGMKKVVEALGKDVVTYAFGDGANDYEMILEADFGIAMGNGLKMIKKIADYVTADVNEDGVGKALKHFGLI